MVGVVNGHPVEKLRPLTWQQRFLLNAGQPPDGTSMLRVRLADPTAHNVRDRLLRALADVPTLYVRLTAASRYDPSPSVAFMASDDRTGLTPTVRVTIKRDDVIEIVFDHLHWDATTIVGLLAISLSGGGGDIQAAPYEMFRHELCPQIGACAYEMPQLADTSPKLRRGCTLAPFYRSGSLLKSNSSDLAKRLAETLAAKAFGRGEILREIRFPGVAPSYVGNLAYPIPATKATRVGSAAETWTLLGRLNGPRAYSVANAASFVELTNVKGVVAVKLRGLPHGTAAHFAIYAGDGETTISASYASTAFDERESDLHFRDVMAALRGIRPLRPDLSRLSRPAIPGPLSKTLMEALEREPDLIAVQTAQYGHSRAELLSHAKRIASALPPDIDRIGLLYRNGYDFIACVVACVISGVCYVPLDLNASTDRLEAIVCSASLRSVLCHPDDEALAKELGLVCVRTASLPAANRPRTIVDPTIYRVYTSGTTGEPKPVDVRDSNLRALFGSYASISHDIYKLSWGFTSSIGFDASVKQYLGPLLFGGIVFVPSAGLTQAPIKVLREMQAAGASVLNLTPQLLRVAVDSGLCDFRYVLVSGDTLPPRLVDDFHKRAPFPAELVNLYGPTETTINTTAYALKRDVSYIKVPIGETLGGGWIEIVDAAQEAVPYGVPGSLRIRGPIVTAGRDLPGGEKFGWSGGNAYYDTGDECFSWYDNLVYFVGRKDRQMKVAGVRTDLDEIENWLRRSLNVATCYVDAVEQRLHAVFVRGEVAARPDVLAQLDAPIRYGHLGLIPIILDNIPIGINGKVQLSTILSAKAASAAAARPAESILELEIEAAIVSALNRRGEVLASGEKLGFTEGIFRRHVDSLLALEVTLELSERFGVELAPNQLFEEPTIRGLASVIAKAGGRTSLIHTYGALNRERLAVLLPPVTGTSLALQRPSSALAGCNLVAACSYPTIQKGFATIEDIAAAIEDELRQRTLLRPQTTIVGYSMGGAVAFELCKRLEGAGMSVKITILDKPVEPRGDREFLEREADILLNQFASPDRASSGLRKKIRRDMRSNIESVLAYRPTGKIAASTTLVVCAAEARPVSETEWRPFLRTSPRVVEIDCRHHELLSPPFVDEVASTLGWHADDDAQGD